ncbi:MAG: hypothetical protein NDI94_03505 [Candidatus Woesearchaeota archaeon]|nr:hypothetical protein [Candidatus Woesearchaeota archaeon]
MKRKIVKSGPSTLVVSIPFEYIHRFKLKKGDEIDVTIKDNMLIMSYDKVSYQTKISISFDGMDVSTAWRFFNSVYAAGFDFVEITYTMPEIRNEKTKKSMQVRELLQKMAYQNIGLEITEMKQGYALFSELAEIKENEIETTIKRIFFILKSMISACLENADSLDIYLSDADLLMNKFTNYAQRIISKKGHKNNFLSTVYSRLLDYLEIIGDDIKKISLSRSKKAYQAYALVSGMIEDLYDLYYNYSRPKLREIILRLRESKQKLKEIGVADDLAYAIFISELIDSSIDRVIEIKNYAVTP